MGTNWGRLLLCSLLIVAGIPAISAIPIYPGNFTAHFINVGQGDAIFVVSPSNNTTLIDSGPNGTMGTKVSEYIQEAGLGLDVVIATHSDADHIGGMESVLAAFTPKAFIDSPYPTIPWTATYQDMRDAINQSEIPYVTVTSGSSIPSYQGLNISILNPQEVPFSDTNDNSIVFRLQYGSIAFLFTGDAEHAAENVMMNNGSDLQAQILKVGEHGSSSSSSPAFLARVEPEVAVIEVGAGNQYDHPAHETLENLIAAGARIFRTDLNGTVVITTDGSDYSVHTEPSQNITATAGPGGTIAPNGIVKVNYGDTPIFSITPNSIGTGSTSIPVIPQGFYGYVEAMGQPVQVGIPIEVRGIGVKSGIAGNPFIINETGEYGSPEFFGPKMYVQGNITDGTLLTFYVNGHPAKVSSGGGPLQDAYPFTRETTTSLNLSVPEPVDNPLPIPASYVIQDVIVDGISKGPVTSYQFDPVTTDHTISAIFEPIYQTLTILADSGGGGVIEPNGTVMVAAGADPAFTITPDEGNEILDVTVDNVSVGPVASYTFTNISANHTIHATFSGDMVWIIQAMPGEGGNISPNGNTTVFNGENQTFAITPNAGHEILDVIVDNASVGPVSSYTFTNVIANHTISATFVQTVFAIVAEVGPDGMGTITPSGVVDVSVGANQTFIITPDPGQLDCWGSGTRFVIWNITVDGQVIQDEPSLLPVNYTFMNVSANHTILVNFAEMIIDARPLAKFNATPRSGFVPLPVHFSQVRVSNNTGLLWSFGDNTTSTDQNPNHTYSAPGTYNVSLTIYCDDESFTEEQPAFIHVKMSPPPIGGNKGYFLVHSNVDGALVFFDDDFKGNITNGTLNVSVYVTATPYRTYTVTKSGYNDFTGQITQYPGKGGTVDLYATLTQGGFFNFNFHFVDFPALRFVNFPSFYPF